MSTRQKTFEVLDQLTEGRYHGRTITELVYERISRRPYDSTILTYCRDYADYSGAIFECIEKTTSLYYFKPNIKITGALID